MWDLKVSLLSMRTPRSRILSMKDIGGKRIVHWLGVMLLPVVLMEAWRHLSGANCNCHFSLHSTNLSIAVCKEELWGDDDVEQSLMSSANSLYLTEFSVNVSITSFM